GGWVAPGARGVLGLVEREAERGLVVAQIPDQGEVGRAAIGLRGSFRGGGWRAEVGEGIVAGRLERAASDRKARANVLSTFLGVEVELLGQLVALDQHARRGVAEE